MTASGGFQHVLVWLFLTAKCKGFLHKLPAHGTLLEVTHTAVAQARVPARQEHPVDAPVLAHHTVLAALLHRLRFAPSQAGLLQQALLGTPVCRGGVAGGAGATICRHEKLLKVKETSRKAIVNNSYSLNLGGSQKLLKIYELANSTYRQE